MRVNELYKSLRSTYDDWSDFLINPQFVRREEEIIWQNYAPPRLAYPILRSDIAQLIDKGQYTFQVSEDDSIIQIYYRCQKNKVLKANLAFYSLAEAPAADGEVTDLEEDLWDEPSFNLPREDGPVGWLRIDYAPQEERGVLHHHCHLHLNAFPEARFVVDGLPTPKQFIEWIVSLCYPEKYKAHRLNQDWHYQDHQQIQAVNSLHIQIAESEICNYISHFRIPRN